MRPLIEVPAKTAWRLTDAFPNLGVELRELRVMVDEGEYVLVPRFRSSLAGKAVSLFPPISVGLDAMLCQRSFCLVPLPDLL